MEWISVNDEMPKEHKNELVGVYASEMVLAVITCGNYRSISIEQTINGKWDVESKHDVKVTHWMSCPELPER